MVEHVIPTPLLQAVVVPEAAVVVLQVQVLLVEAEVLQEILVHLVNLASSMAKEVEVDMLQAVVEELVVMGMVQVALADLVL